MKERRRKRSKSGIIFIDKPKEWTSNDVTNILRGVFGTRKVGHAGTLDPFATGLLIVGVERGTKLLPYFQKEEKEYEVTAHLGMITASYDTETPPEFFADGEPTMEELQEALQDFQGEILQLPPAHSAVRIKGERAFVRARQGKAVELTPRHVHIYDLEVLDYTYPLLTLRVVCSKGTYIRSLVHDLGQRLGVGSYATELRRTRIGSILAENRLSIKHRVDPTPYMEQFTSIEEVRLTFPDLSLTEQELGDLFVGKPQTTSMKDGLVHVLNGEGHLMGIGMVSEGQVRMVVWTILPNEEVNNSS